MTPSTVVIISDTATYDVRGCYQIIVLADAVISSAAGNLTGYATITLPALTRLKCSLTSITLASGKIAVNKILP